MSMQTKILALLLGLLSFGTSIPATAQIAVRADTVHTMAGDPIVDGVVLVEGGVIAAVGPASGVEIPSGYETYEAVVVTPGLIDARSTVGLAGIYNRPYDQDQLDTSAPIQPGLRAIDAYNPREDLVAFLRGLGVTTVHTGHGPGALVSGQTAIFKTTGTTINEALVDSVTMVALTLGPQVGRSFDSPGTSAKGVAMLRAALPDAQQYAEEEPSERAPDLGKQALVRVLEGELPALITAQEATEIQAALRLAEEFGFDLVLDGGAESYLLIDEIEAAGVPVIVHPTMARPGGAMASAAFTTAGRLHEAGIPVVFQSGFEAYVPRTRVVLFEAAVAAANGMPRAEALRAVTIDAARLLGIDERVGSIEEGKEADLALFDGDPFEYTTRTCTVLIGGEVVSDTCI